LPADDTQKIRGSKHPPTTLAANSLRTLARTGKTVCHVGRSINGG
jgi:hypothetical protein